MWLASKLAGRVLAGGWLQFVVITYRQGSFFLQIKQLAVVAPVKMVTADG